MKVYVLIDEWARDFDGDVHVLGVYTDREEARKEMLKEEKERFLTEMDTCERDDDCVCQYNAGEYYTMHDRLFVQEQELRGKEIDGAQNVCA